MGKEWTKQRKRARTIMEDMMIRQTPLRPQDVKVIAENPIVSPMFRLLLLRQGTTTGFYTNEGLETLKWRPEDKSRRAHYHYPRPATLCRWHVVNMAKTRLQQEDCTTFQTDIP